MYSILQHKFQRDVELKQNQATRLCGPPFVSTHSLLKSEKNDTHPASPPKVKGGIARELHIYSIL